MTGTNLYFIRHGQTDWNLQGRFQGVSDIPLNKAGREQSLQIGRELAKRIDDTEPATGEMQIVSSPLLRARQSAEIICEELRLDSERISYSPHLREVSYGDWEGMTTLEVKTEFPIARKARKADRWAFSPPGGEAPLSRVPILQDFLKSLDPPVVVVTHTGVIRICLYLLGLLERESALAEPISQDKIYVVSNASLAR
ncbi:MAG: histidine phosphatase family protein [Hyphomicrobiales bacterium]|nr:histidine phosphatase family protein [Hyphomicrobiales bacterium]